MIRSKLREIRRWWSRRPTLSRTEETLLMGMGQQLSQQQWHQAKVDSLADAEFRVFSQFGDDGIIHWLTKNVDFPFQTFIEFGVEDYTEANTRFLLCHQNWSGLVIDGSAKNVQAITQSSLYWRHDLQANQAFIDCENVQEEVERQSFGRNIGILHIDIDGNDYWIWDALASITPALVIMEYNAVFGDERAISIPYRPDFVRTQADPSNLYFGASLRAFQHLADQRGYTFLGCNSAGNNAYFLREDLMNDSTHRISQSACFVDAKFRESRSTDGRLTFRSGPDRGLAIKGLPVTNVLTLESETL